MNEDQVEYFHRRTPFAPLQCRALEPNIKSSCRQTKVYYLSPLEIENLRRRRAKEFRLTPPPTDSFLHNQSFPGFYKDPENGNLCVDMGNIHRCSIDKFKGDALDSISFSLLKVPQKNSEIHQNQHLDESWTLYKYIETNLECHNSHVYTHNPKKLIVVINPRTTEILTVNKEASHLLGLSNEDSAKLSDYILSPQDQYLFTEADLKPNGEVVLFSGKVMELVISSDEIIPVSIWAKQMSVKSNERCLVIMEPVERLTGRVKFNSMGEILNCDQNFASLYGYERIAEVMKLSIKEFLPSLDLEAENLQSGNIPLEGLKLCSTGKTKDNFNFPLNINILPCSLQETEIEAHQGDDCLEAGLPLYEGTIWVFSNISGLITVLPDGSIHSCNTNFSMMFFGYTQDELVGKDISILIPDFHEEIELLDTNSVALPPFDDDTDSNAKCGTSDGRTTADSLTSNPPRPMNPLGKIVFDDEVGIQRLAFSPLSRESLSSTDHSSNLEDIYDNENLKLSSSHSKEEMVDSDKNEEQSSSIVNSAKHMSCSESQDTLHSCTNSIGEADVNANILELIESEEHLEYVATSKSAPCDDKEAHSDNFDSDSDCPESELSESGEESFDSEDSACSGDVAIELPSWSKGMCSPPCGCLHENNNADEQHSPGCYTCNQVVDRKISTPKKSNQSTPKSSHDTSYQSIPEGIYIGMGRHKDGRDLAVEYYIKKVQLDSGKFLYCLWISREEIKEGSLMTNKTSSNSYYESSKNAQSGSEVSGSSSASTLSSALPDEEYLAGPFSEHYTVVQHLGKGAFGCIKKAYRNADGLLVIAKFIRKSEVYKDSWVFDHKVNKKIPLEISLLITIEHPNIVKVIDIFENEQCFHMVMEKHGSGMDLFEFIERNPQMSEDLSSYIFRQMVSALSYLHGLNILHRDIKDENVIIDEKFHVKLIDFGSAAFMGDELFSTFCGTTEYCSPEVLQGNKYRGPELEMFALGVTLFTLILGQNPFIGADEILKGEYTIDKEISESLSGLIKHMLEPNPLKRCTLPEVENHPWVNQPVKIEDYEFSDVVKASEDELHPIKYISFTESENELESSNYTDSEKELSLLEKKIANMEMNAQSFSSTESEIGFCS